MKNITIQKKIFFYICSLTTLSIITIGFVSYTLFFQTLEKNEIEYSIQSSNKTKQNIEFFLKLVDNTATLLASNKELLEELNLPYSSLNPNYATGQNKINTMLQNIISVQEYIKGIYIVGPNGNFYTSDWGVNENELRKKYNLLYYQELSMDEYYTGVHQNNYHSFSETNVISYVKPIFEFPSGKNLGTIIIDLNYDYLKEMFTISSIESDEKVLVINPEGKKIFNFPYNTILDDVIDNNPELLKFKKTILNKKVFGKDSIIVSNTIDYSDWKIIRIISADKIHRDTNALGTVALSIFILFIIFSLSASLVLSFTLTKPIKELNNKIKLVEQGDLSVNVKVQSSDELGQLSESFNNMIIKLRELINKVLEEQKKKSDMEFQILQAQINPHFLYNTLDSIKWLAVIQNVHSIGEMATALINLLKYNISRNSLNVTLAEELESVNNYIKIQKYRYGDIFDVKYSVEERTQQCKILRFILQPIVENAIFHGFENMEGNGIIEINSLIKNEYLIIEVVDNGVGMDVNTLDNITKDKNYEKKFSGIGIRNIGERIKLYFGEKYGISFSSELNKGTKVTLTLPVIYKNNSSNFI
jgi:two-component system sensor histidine kinase YesM